MDTTRQVSRRDFLRLSGTAGAMSAAGMRIRWSGEHQPQVAGQLTHVTAQAAGQTVSSTPELHVLNRLTWGIRPADIDRVKELGIEGYIDWQLDAENISDPLTDEYVAGRRILSMSWAELANLGANQYEQILQAILGARVFRAIYSERQLYELLVEFWTDHFNIPIQDLLAEKVIDDREVIRAHALGSFRELLFASARSAAMLQYLNNDTSSAEHPNENYAREVMELHTLGVDGGYTEQDVKEVARALTGWTVRDGAFSFNPAMHDTDEKVVLGHRLAAGRGIEDGLDVMNILAGHPATARFIAYKLVRRFVSDVPPEALVESAAAVFTATDGNIREVLRHILKSDSFMAAIGQKLRRPLDYVVAMVRVMSPGIQIGSPVELVWALEPLGHIPFGWHPPDGYPDVAAAWISTSGLLYRWNLALRLALAGEGYFDGVSLNIEQVVPIQATIGDLVDAASQRLLGGLLAASDRDQVIAMFQDVGTADTPLTADMYYIGLPVVIGVLLASPYFQWR